MHDITLHKQWVIKASIDEVFKIMTDFEKLPQYFPKVAEAVQINKRGENYLEMEATVKSFGKKFQVRMKTQIIPGKGFISDNDSYQFGTSGHEEFLLSPHAEGTLIDYTYQVNIHKPWLRLIATPLIRWYSMKYWEKAVIDELKKILEKNKTTLYNVVSSDGFIAREDGSEDFISENVWPNTLNLYLQYGAIIMGRKTHDTIQSYDKELVEPFEKLTIKKIVVTNNPDFKPKDGYTVVHSPQEAIALAPDALVSSGPTLNNFLLKNHLVKKIIHHEVPVDIGEGIKPFDIEGITLVPIENVQNIEGVTVREYRVL
ncbi:MAG: SRPBCC family protein [bacterium]